MTVKVMSRRRLPPSAGPRRLVVVNAPQLRPRWNGRLATRAALVGALLGGLVGILGVLLAFRALPIDTLLTYAATGYAAGTAAGAVAGLALGALTGMAAAHVSRRRPRWPVEHPQRMWVRHRTG